MKATVTFEDGRTHEMESGQFGIIKMGLTQLMMYRDDGRVPSQALLDDIAGYESIVHAKDAADRAREYFYLKAQNQMLRPREIARMKGWI